MERKNTSIYLLLLACLISANVWGQTNDDPYNNKWNDLYGSKTEITTNMIEILHKPAKWHDLRKNLNGGKEMHDTFSGDSLYTTITTEDGKKIQIQATHTLVDTIYTKKGNTVELHLPDRDRVYVDNDYAQFSIRSYQRWYNYRTDGLTFKVNGTDQELLTPGFPFGKDPDWGISINPYRMENGYVGYPLITDIYDQKTELSKYNYPLINMKFHFPQNGGNEYQIACDVSSYTDFTLNYHYGKEPPSLYSSDSTFIRTENGNTICYEPTLSHRIIYVIRAIDNTDDWRNKALTAQQESGDDFLEEYEISMPTIRYDDTSDEMVALTADASSYMVPGEETPGELTISIDKNENTAGITLTDKSKKLSGEKRVISFTYPNTFQFNGENYGDGLIKTVNSTINPTATIKVTKTVNSKEYRLVKFKLNFVSATTLLSQSVIKQLNDKTPGVEKTPWKAYEFRTDRYLAENYELLTELNFDYDPMLATDGNEFKYYPFPLSWPSSSYAFFDGSLLNNIKGGKGRGDFIIGAGDAGSTLPEWGYYSITAWANRPNTITTPEIPRLNSEGKPSTFHMFADVSDRPNRIAQMRFQKQLCQGAELFVTAWVKARGARTIEDRGSMLFTIIGVDSIEPDKQIFTPIYRHQTGQIPSTNPGKSIANPQQLPGFGNSDWLQVYFSFVNHSSETPYDYYVLQIDNNSPSTKGCDFFLDDIRVYMIPPRAQILQKSYGCKDDTPLLRMRLGWNRLLSRSGLTESTETDKGKEEHISFCFVDSLKYHEALATTGTDDRKKAFEDAVVPLSYPLKKDESRSDTVKYGKLLYNTYFVNNTKYDIDINAINRQEKFKESDKAATRLFRMEDTGVERSLAADIYADLKPFRTYYLILESPHTNDPGEGAVPDAERFSDFYLNSDNNCVAKTTFQIESEGAIMINGELSNQDTKYCAGKVLNFGVQLQADLDGKGEKPVEGEVFYDWFLGKKDAYNEDSKTGINIGSALTAFRSLYPEVIELDEWEPENDQDKNMKALLQGKVEAKTLVLNRSHLNFHLPKSGLDMMVRVIPKSVTTDEKKAVLICADPIEIHVNAEGESPQASIGFHDVTYPDTDPDATTPDATDKPDLSYHPVVRIGKAQIDQIVNTSNQLKLPLRNVVINTDGNQLKKADQPYVYLIASNDPKLQSVFHREGGFNNTDWPVGTIDAFQATKGGEGNNCLTFHFGKPTDLADETIPVVDFREGFWYTLEVNFSETGAAKETNTCNGNLIFDLKVVPEYQKWTGTANGNWNNDANWQRSSAEELHKTTDKDAYDEGYTNPDSIFGFVPMSFTNVTVPESRQIQLYEPTGKTQVAPTSNDSHIIWNLSTTELSDMTTPYIEYDLMVKKVDAATTNDAGTIAFDCETYYTNTVRQIHFEPAAEMLHAEYLTYDKAWVDYKLNSGRWYTLTSPLQSVVAGDWYTPSTTAQQTTEYFKDITFIGANYSRFQPSVYQRGWKRAANMITISSGSNIDNSRTVAIAGNWSGVYNKVDELYTPGTGFSVKVLDLPMAASGSALFRFPKADTEYSYYSSGTNSTGSAVQVRTDDDQKNVGKLKSDELKLKNPTFTVTLNENTASEGSNYHLIGNPFMAHLNAQKFFEANTNLQQKFWLVTKDNQSAAVGSNDNDWITTESTEAGTGTPTIAPLQSFFVEKTADNSTNTVTFKADMQVLGSTNAGLKSSSVSSVSSPVLTLTATTADGRRSRAAIAYDPAASDEYKANEDAELFIDSNLSNIPAIYTVAGTMAASINRTPVLWDIPVGIYSTGNSSETVTLSFEGLDLFPGTTLYDAEKKTETVLHGNSILTIPANTSGRYFLRAGTPTGNEKVEAGAIRIYTIAHRQLIVTATENLQTVAIYDFAGRLLRYSDNLSGYLFTTDLDKGNYIVKATSKRQQQTSKIQIR